MWKKKVKTRFDRNALLSFSSIVVVVCCFTTGRDWTARLTKQRTGLGSGRSTDRVHTVLCLTLADYLTAFLPACLTAYNACLHTGLSTYVPTSPTVLDWLAKYCISPHCSAQPNRYAHIHKHVATTTSYLLSRVERKQRRQIE